MSIDHGKLLALSPEAIEAGWRATFSTDNPFCPCDLKTFAKAARWAERALAQPAEAVEYDDEIGTDGKPTGYWIRRSATDAAQGAVADVSLTARKLLADQFPHQITKDLLVIDGRTDGVVDTTLALAAIEDALRTHPQAAPAQGDWKMIPAVKSVASDAELLGYLDDLIAAQGTLMFARENVNDQHAQDFGVGLMDFMRLHGLRLRQIVAAAPSQEGES